MQITSSGTIYCSLAVKSPGHQSIAFYKTSLAWRSCCALIMAIGQTSNATFTCPIFHVN